MHSLLKNVVKNIMEKTTKLNPEYNIIYEDNIKINVKN